MNPFRSKKWLEAVRSIQCCVLCGRYGVQASHRNEGQGMGQKTSDCLTAALCQECHYEIDNGKEYSREERRASMDRAIVLTVERLAINGVIKI